MIRLLFFATNFFTFNFKCLCYGLSFPFVLVLVSAVPGAAAVPGAVVVPGTPLFLEVVFVSDDIAGF